MQVRLVTPILKANDELARRNRALFDEAGVTVVNLISSPGSGKTTLLERTIEALGGKLSLGVVEGDIQTTRDAERIGRKGVPVVQINTRGACHLDASMVSAALEGFPLERLDLLFIENVGNLVCPAEFDLGEHARVAVLSVAEGNDKVAKYPLVFRRAAALVLSKLDLLPHTDFRLQALEADLAEINPGLPVYALSARTGEGMDRWCQWLTRLAARKASPATG